MEGFANLFAAPAAPANPGPGSAPLPGLGVAGDANSELAGRLDAIERALSHALGSMTATPQPAPAPAGPVPFGAPAPTTPMPYLPPGAAAPVGSAFPTQAAPVDKRPAIHATLDTLLADIPGGADLAAQGHSYVDQIIAAIGIDQAECLVNTLVDARKYAKAGQDDVVRALLNQWPGGAMMAALMSR